MPMPKVDFKGFEKEVRAARAVIKFHGHVYALYIPDTGFKFRSKIEADEQYLIDEGHISLVGHYQKPLKSEHIIDDFIFELDQRFGVKKNARD